MENPNPIHPEPPKLPLLERLIPTGAISKSKQRVAIFGFVVFALAVIWFSAQGGNGNKSAAAQAQPISSTGKDSVGSKRLEEGSRELAENIRLAQDNADKLAKAQTLQRINVAIKNNGGQPLSVAQAQAAGITPEMAAQYPGLVVMNPAAQSVANYPNGIPCPPENPACLQVAAAQSIPSAQQTYPPASYSGYSAPVAHRRGPDSLIVQDLRHSVATQTAAIAPAATAIPTPVQDHSQDLYNPQALPQTAAPQQASTTMQHRDLLAFDKSRPTLILPEYTVIETVLTNKLEGSGVGPVNTMVTTPIYAPGTRTVLIPAGTRFLGDSSAVSNLNQARLAVTFHRMIIGTGPEAYSVSLDKDPGLDQQGGVGLHGKVNNHWASTLGLSLVVGGIGGLSQLGNGNYGGLNGIDPSTAMRNGISSSMAQSSMQILDRMLNRLPTVVVPPGSRVKLMLVGDLQVPIYHKED